MWVSKNSTRLLRNYYIYLNALDQIYSATSFLCTRVNEPTKTDQKKLIRLLGYLQTTRLLKYHLTPAQPLSVVSYIDAAFETHDDSKSHSGVTIFVAGMLVYASSKKQTCVTKSPTESELVALTANIGLVELFEEFITFLIKDKIPTPVIY